MTHRGVPTRASSRAFTLLELMVVIALIVVLVAVTLPSIARIVESANYSAAINLVTATLGNARTIAMQRQQYAGVAFLFDSVTESYTLIPIERLGGQGSLTRRPTDQSKANAMIFRPALNSAPSELPRGTGVYGLSFAIASKDEGAINRPSGGEPATAAWYEGEIIKEGMADQVIPWIFPRNDPRLFMHVDQYLYPNPDPWLNQNGVLEMTADRKAAVRHANSFCVVFTPQGSVETGTAIGEQNLENAYIELPDAPFDTNDPERKPYDDPTRFDPEADQRADTGGPISSGMRNPEVILRTVSQLAVVDFGRMVAGTGVDKPWQLHAGGSKAPWPQYTGSGGETPSPSELDDLVKQISKWIDENAEVIGFDRYTGNAMKRK